MSTMNAYNAMAEETEKIRHRLRLADAKLLEHEIEWDGEKYSFNPSGLSQQQQARLKRDADAYSRIKFREMPFTTGEMGQ